MKIEIKHHVTDALLWAGEAENLKSAVVQAVSNKADLRGADLSGAYLSGAIPKFSPNTIIETGERGKFI